jgi:hypothetical protein
MSNPFFFIQPCNPRVVEVPSMEEDLNGLIQVRFPLENDFAVLSWNLIFIPLCYRYDISFMIEDILGLLDWCYSDRHQPWSVNWASNTFDAGWIVTASGTDVCIETQWRSVIGEIESSLNERPTVTVSVQDLIAEWTKLLSVVLQKIEPIEWAKNVDGYSRLVSAIEPVRR